MYIELENKDLIKQVENITLGDYETKADMLNAKDVEEMIKDLLIKIDELEEKIQDEIENKHEYWKPKTQDEIARGI